MMRFSFSYIMIPFPDRFLLDSGSFGVFPEQNSESIFFQIVQNDFFPWSRFGNRTGVSRIR